jgi:hypothetical protein
MTGEQPSESLYQHAGGDEGLRKIVDRFYSSIFEDPILQPVFGHPVATHVDHLTAFLAEEFGGPSRWPPSTRWASRAIRVSGPLSKARSNSGPRSRRSTHTRELTTSFTPQREIPQWHW